MKKTPPLIKRAEGSIDSIILFQKLFSSQTAEVIFTNNLELPYDRLPFCSMHDINQYKSSLLFLSRYFTHKIYLF